MKIKLLTQVYAAVEEVGKANQSFYARTKVYECIPSTFAMIVECNNHTLVVKLEVDSESHKILNKKILKLI